MSFLPALTAVAPIVSGVANYFSQKETNKMQAQEAEKNRAFQATQSASAYQTAVQDMRKAGLNPALAYSQGGAQAMSGGTAQFSAPEIADVSGGFSSAYQQKMAGEQLEQTQLMNAEAIKTQATQQMSNLASAKQSAASAEKITQDKQNSIAQLALATNDQKLKKTALDQTLKNQQEQARLTNLQGHTVSAKLKGIQADSDWQAAESGYKAKNAGWIVPLNQGTDSVGRILDGISSALNIADKFRPVTEKTRSYSPKTGEIIHERSTSRRGR